MKNCWELQASLFTAWELAQEADTPPEPRALFAGRPGTGKSLTPWLWAQARGMDVVRFTVTEDQPSSDLEGKWILKGGEFSWHDGYVTRAWRASHTNPHGSLIIMDEIDHAGPDIISKLHNVLDDQQAAVMYLPNEEVIRPRAGRMFSVATMNGLPEDLPEALLDRFPITIIVDRPHPNAVNTLRENLRKLAENAAVIDDPTRRLSIRKFKAYEALEKLLGEEDAAELVFNNKGQDITDAIMAARIR